MRAILIDPLTRTIAETNIPLTQNFMQEVAKWVGANALALDVVPGKSAMFLDAIGFLRETHFFWRFANSENMAGAALIFGLGPDGKLTDAPAELTTAAIGESVLWVEDTIERTVERMEIVEYPGGLAPRINRQIVWKRGAVVPASAPAPAEVDLYAPAEPGKAAQPAPSAPSPATPVAAEAQKPPTASPAASPLAPIWAIHETADNRYRLIEYEVTDAGIGAVLSLSTMPNLDAARAKVPAGLAMRPADDDASDDTLVETWS